MDVTYLVISEKKAIESYASDLVSDIFSSVKTSLAHDHSPAGTNRTTVQTHTTSTSEVLVSIISSCAVARLLCTAI